MSCESVWFSSSANHIFRYAWPKNYILTWHNKSTSIYYYFVVLNAYWRLGVNKCYLLQGKNKASRALSAPMIPGQCRVSTTLLSCIRIRNFLLWTPNVAKNTIMATQSGLFTPSNDSVSTSLKWSSVHLPGSCFGMEPRSSEFQK